MEKTLGGDRLGSGKKMKVHLHGYERSTHNKGYIWRSTMSVGTLVPYAYDILLPGDTYDIDLDAYVNTHPTIGPLFGSIKMQLDMFVAPMRLYNSWLHNNMLNIGRNMSQVKLPQIRMTALAIDNPADIDNCQINPSSLLAYLGIRGIGYTTETKTRDFQAMYILAYWEIYKNYYANKQEEIGAVLHTPSEAPGGDVDQGRVYADGFGSNVVLAEAPANSVIFMQPGDSLGFTYSGADPIPSQIRVSTDSGEYSAVELTTGGWTITGGLAIAQFDFSRWGAMTLYNWRIQTNTDIQTGMPAVATFPLEHIDDMRNAILAASGGTQYNINTLNKEPYKWLYEQPNGIPNVLSSQEGLGLKTYQSDLFNNWLSTEWIDGSGGITEITAISTVGDSFTLDTLNLSKKVYDMLNRIAVSGGSYDDWLDAVYAHDRYQRCESPMYMGGLTKEIIFQEVVSNSEAEGGGSGTQPLGTLAGKGTLSKKHKGGSVIIKVDEPSVLIGIVSLTPRIDYSQGNDWSIHLKTMDDLHKPALDEIGFQELITEQMAWWSTDNVADEWVQKSAGKQPAWINYMTNINKTYGNFAIQNNEMFMTLNRRYEFDPSVAIDDLTTYIDPSKYNFIFAQTALDAQNYWVQIGLDITARRKMSAKVMPNL